MTVSPPALLVDILKRWRLTPDGALIERHSSILLPVTRDGAPAMLKIARDPTEKTGNAVMAWWNGDGAARVLAYDGDAVLLERASSGISLADFARDGRDDEATRILCAVIARLHVPRPAPPPPLTPLLPWFNDLFAVAPGTNTFAFAAQTARALLDEPQEISVLHGDIHHENVLDFGTRGWLAIDPKGLHGERGFDYANIFCNPEHDTMTVTQTFDSRIALIASLANLDRRRLLQWIVAWTGLSSVWHIGDGTHPAADLAVMELATARLNA